MRFYMESEGEVIVNNLDEVCNQCLHNCSTIGTINNNCGLENLPKRNGIIRGKKRTMFLCCGETKTTKLFREKLENLSYSIPDFEKIKDAITKEIAKTEQLRFKRVVHNLKSLNGHNIQELYNLVPQEILTSNIEGQLGIIKDYLIDNLDQAAMTFIRIAKHNSHMKAEFAIHDRIFTDSPQLNTRNHPIRKVLMNVLHTFFIDFDEKDVRVHVTEDYSRISIDYESIHVAFYHVIENASKYIRPHSEFFIRFTAKPNVLSVSFEMDSLHIYESEIDKVFEEGYSGINAQRAKRAGQGIGMGRIKKLLELNGALLTIEAGKKIKIFDGFEYSRNMFNVDFKSSPPMIPATTTQ